MGFSLDSLQVPKLFSVPVSYPPSLRLPSLSVPPPFLPPSLLSPAP